MSRRCVLGVLMVGCLVAGGCGDGGDSGSEADEEEQQYVDALAEQLDARSEQPSLSTPDYVCFSESIVGVLGVEAFRQADLNPDDLPTGKGPVIEGLEMPADDVVGEIADRLAECTDIPLLLAQSYLSPAAKDARPCFAEQVDPEAANRAYVLLLIANHEAIDLDVKQSWIDTAAECNEETYGPGTPVTFGRPRIA